MRRHRAGAALALLCGGCSSSSTGTSAAGDEPSAPVAWKFETVSWYNRYSMNSTIGPLVVGRTVLYGGTYAYQNTKASKLAALDATTGMARWRMDYGAAFGPLVLQRGMIAVAAGDRRARPRPLAWSARAGSGAGPWAWRSLKTAHSSSARTT